MAQKTIKRKTIREEEYVSSTTCELCGRSTKNDRDWGGEDANVNHATVMLEVGYGHGDGGNIQQTIVDVCPDCFKSKMLPWLASQGANPRTDEIDW